VLSIADRIWNRACLEVVSSLGAGDIALAAMVRFDGVVQNGGFIHAVGVFSPEELAGAKAGFRYFDFEEVAQLIAEAQFIISVSGELTPSGEDLDRRYATMTISGSDLQARFKETFARSPSEFAPV